MCQDSQFTMGKWNLYGRRDICIWTPKGWS